jgi:hypothetical protein
MVTINIKDNEEKTWKEKGYKIGEGEWRGGHVKELRNFGNRKGVNFVINLKTSHYLKF